MQRNRLFNRTRWRLAAWTTVVMAAISGLSVLAFERLLTRSSWRVLHQELAAVAGTLHDSLEPKLWQLGRVSPEAARILPGICIFGVANKCPTPVEHRHILGAAHREGYFVQLLSPSGELLAVLGEMAHREDVATVATLWETLSDRQGKRYHRISLPLKNARGQFWGYVQVGRSIADLDDQVLSRRWVLLVVWPLSVGAIALASWWLAGLAMRPVYESYQLVQQFTADAAHELRTPLAAVRATLEASLQAPTLPEPEARSTLQTLARQTGRLAQLVQDLLWLSRADSQTHAIAWQPCRLDDLVNDAIEEFAAMAIEAGVILSAELPEQPPTVWGDEAQLYRAIANLIANGIQYTAAGGQVAVTLQRDDRRLLLQVRDTGIGIAPADLPRVFDRFYRAMGDRSRQTGGSGLGLAIAQSIVRAHQGELTVISQPGHGSTFTIALNTATALPYGRTSIEPSGQKITRNSASGAS